MDSSQPLELEMSAPGNLTELPVHPVPLRSLGRLAALRRRIRGLFLADGLASMGWAAVIGVAASFALDYLLILPPAVRLVFLLAGMGAMAHFLFRDVLRAFSRPASDADLANLLERCHPELGQSLITAVELSRPGSETAAHVSRTMIASIVRGVEERIEALDCNRAIDASPVRRKSAALALAAAVLLAAGLLNSELASIWLRRNVLLAADRWPKDVELELVSPRLPAVVAVGDSLEVAVRALRGSPAAVVVSSWEEGRTGRRADSLSETTSKTFRKVFDNVSRPFQFAIRGDDDEIGPFAVDVRLRPRIDMQSIRIWCEYPPHTGLAGTPEDEPFRHGNLKVPSGTKVHYAMEANVPIEKAYFVFVPAAADSRQEAGRARSGEASMPGSPYAGGEAGAAEAPAGKGPGEAPEDATAVPDPGAAAWPDPGSTALEIAGEKAFSGEFGVTQGGQYYFQLQAVDGFRSIKPDRFRVEAIPDRKPLVKIIDPQRITEEVSPEALVRVRVSASDDYGIEKGVIEGVYFPAGSDAGVNQSFPLPKLSAPEAPPANGGSDPPAAAAKGPRSREDDVVIRVSDLRTGGEGPPRPGSRFQYFALASDLGGNIGESDVHILQVVEKEDLLKILTDHLMLTRDQLREIGRRQKSARKDLEAFQSELALGAPTSTEGQKLYRHRQDQERVTQALQREMDELERILARTAANNVGDEKWKAWVGGIRDDIHKLARRKSPEIEKGLEEARAGASEGPRGGKLGPITGAQREIERDLDNIVLRLSEFGDLNALLQMLREVRRRQADLREETRTRVEGKGEKAVPKTPPGRSAPDAGESPGRSAPDPGESPGRSAPDPGDSPRGGGAVAPSPQDPPERTPIEEPQE